jgi:putative peptidoglycan lipid II flippase
VSGGRPPGGPGPPETAELPPEDSTPAFVRHTAVMAVGTSLSRVTGFLRLTAMAFALGITETRLADSYNIANITPNIIYELALGGVLSSVVVPVLVEWMQTRGRSQMWEVARKLLTLAVVALSAIAIIGIVFAPWIVRLYTVRIGPGQEATRELATFFLRWFMPQIVFYGIGAVATGQLNAERRFAAPMFAPILNNLIVIAAFLAFAAMPGPAAGSRELATGSQELVLAIGTTLGVVGMTFALWPSLRRTGFRFAWLSPRHDEAVARIVRLAGWVIVYVAANQLGYLVVLILGAEIQGGYTAYAAAFILFQLPHAIFTVSIVTALLPAMSSRWADGDVPGFRALLGRGIRATAVIVIPAALGYIAIGREIVRLLLEHGVTEAESGELVAGVLAAFAVGLFFFSSFQLFLRAFYSMQDTRTPAIINLGAMVVNVGMNLLLVLVFGLGVRGLALGHAASYVFSSIVAFVVLRRRLGGLDVRDMTSSVGRTLTAAIATGLSAWLVARLVEAWLGTQTLASQLVLVLAPVGVGLIVFMLGALIFRIEEVDTVWRQLFRRRPR